MTEQGQGRLMKLRTQFEGAVLPPPLVEYVHALEQQAESLRQAQAWDSACYCTPTEISPSCLTVRHREDWWHNRIKALGRQLADQRERADLFTRLYNETAKQAEERAAALERERTHYEHQAESWETAWATISNLAAKDKAALRDALAAANARVEALLAALEEARNSVEVFVRGQRDGWWGRDSGEMEEGELQLAEAWLARYDALSAAG